MSKKLWLVGKALYWDEKNNSVWEFAGIFDDEKLAIKACTSEKYFYAPVILNQRGPEETVYFDPCIYPKIEEQRK